MIPATASRTTCHSMRVLTSFLVGGQPKRESELSASDLDTSTSKHTYLFRGWDSRLIPTPARLSVRILRPG